MNCPDRQELMLWLDGELPPEKASEIERHLEECSECRKAADAQRRMETIWRGSWKDPDETAFTIMRSRLVSVTPWWRRQRNWMAVAAVFAVYFGVRIFLIDNSGTSMSQLAREELSVTSGEDSRFDQCPEVMVTAQAETVEEIEEEMEEETSDAPAEEMSDLRAAGDVQQSVSAEVLVEQGDEITELELVRVAEDTTAGFYSIESEMDDSFSYAPPVTVEEELSGESSDMETLATGYGVYGGASGSAGGGGVGGLGTTSVSSSDDYACQDVSVGAEEAEGASVAESRASENQECSETIAKASLSYSVSAHLPTGETVSLARGNWISLFQLIDSFVEQYGTPGEMLHLSIDSTGVVSGADFAGGGVIEAPADEYADCSIVVSVF